MAESLKRTKATPMGNRGVAFRVLRKKLTRGVTRPRTYLKEAIACASSS
jgi:hypothetical protein